MPASTAHDDLGGATPPSRARLTRDLQQLLEEKSVECRRIYGWLKDLERNEDAEAAVREIAHVAHRAAEATPQRPKPMQGATPRLPPRSPAQPPPAADRGAESNPQPKEAGRAMADASSQTRAFTISTAHAALPAAPGAAMAPAAILGHLERILAASRTPGPPSDAPSTSAPVLPSPSPPAEAGGSASLLRIENAQLAAALASSREAVAALEGRVAALERDKRACMAAVTKADALVCRIFNQQAALYAKR